MLLLSRQAALKDELERRIAELMQVRNERDSLLTEKAKMSEQIADFETTLKKNESMFQRTLELDRANIQKEVKVKLVRVRNLEEEKV